MSVCQHKCARMNEAHASAEALQIWLQSESQAPFNALFCTMLNVRSMLLRTHCAYNLRAPTLSSFSTNRTIRKVNDTKVTILPRAINICTGTKMWHSTVASGESSCRILTDSLRADLPVVTVAPVSGRYSLSRAPRGATQHLSWGLAAPWQPILHSRKKPQTRLFPAGGDSTVSPSAGHT